MLSVMLRTINKGKLCCVFTRITELGRTAHEWRRIRRESQTLSGITLHFISDLFSDSVKRTEYGLRDPSRWPRGTLYPQKLVLASPKTGCRSVGIVRLRIQATAGFNFLVFLQWLFIKLANTQLFDFKGFWRWCSTIIITGFLDFDLRPVFCRLGNIRFWKHELFRPSIVQLLRLALSKGPTGASITFLTWGTSYSLASIISDKVWKSQWFWM
jgi:hypothetical protein